MGGEDHRVLLCFTVTITTFLSAPDLELGIWGYKVQILSLREVGMGSA